MKRIALISLASVLFVGCNDATQPIDDEVVVHELRASPSTTHISFFDASLEPVLRIESGDVVRLETATGNPRWFENAGVPRDQIPPELYEVYAAYESTGRGDHTLNGPIFVNGAEPGDVLEIRILSVDVRLPIAGQGIGSRLFPGEIDANVSRVHWIDLVNPDGRICARGGGSHQAILGGDRSCAASGNGASEERRAELLRWQHGQSRPRGGQYLVPAGP